MSLPLAGVRVVDFSRVLAGPYCTMALADLGAEVIKVERPGTGDETRAWGPPFAGGESAYFLSVNRSKRSAAIDLSHAEGRELALELCRGAAVVVENFRAGAAARLGLGYEDVRAVNAGVIYCSITGFGGGGESAGRPGYDFVAQAESGLMQITGEREGEPTKVGVAVVDVLAGLNAAVAVLAALHRRAITGEGERVEVALLDAALGAMVNVAQGALVTGEEPERHGNAHPSIVPYETFAAADGTTIAVAAANDGLFARLCAALERPDLVADERFATNPERVRNRAELVPLLTERFATRPAEAWLAALAEAGVPAGQVRGVLAALEGSGRTVRVEHGTAGGLDLVAPAFSLAGGVAAPTAPPVLGQHTDEVLEELGVGAGRLAALRAAGTVA